MRVFGLAGWSGSGKTTLMTRLIPALIRRGITVSTLKHAHHDFDIDQAGKDSWRHREAGAQEVLVASDRRLDGLGVPVLDINDASAIADFIVAHCRLGVRQRGVA